MEEDQLSNNQQCNPDEAPISQLNITDCNLLGQALLCWNLKKDWINLRWYRKSKPENNLMQSISLGFASFESKTKIGSI